MGVYIWTVSRRLFGQRIVEETLFTILVRRGDRPCEASINMLASTLDACTAVNG